MANNFSKIFLVLVFVLRGNAVPCQERTDSLSSAVTISSMAPSFSEKEIDSLKRDIVTRGDESSFYDCQLAIWSRSKGDESILYEEFFQYALIMAFVYRFPPACHYVYTILNNYRKARGEDLTDDELRLCIRSLSIGMETGSEECKTLNEQLSQALLRRRP